MAEQRMKVRDKKVQKMTKDGLVEENLTDKSSVRVSNRVGDVQMGRKQGEKEENLVDKSPRQSERSGKNIRPSVQKSRDAPELIRTEKQSEDFGQSSKQQNRKRIRAEVGKESRLAEKSEAGQLGRLKDKRADLSENRGDSRRNQTGGSKKPKQKQRLKFAYEETGASVKNDKDMEKLNQMDTDGVNFRHQKQKEKAKKFSYEEARKKKEAKQHSKKAQVYQANEGETPGKKKSRLKFGEGESVKTEKTSVVKKAGSATSVALHREISKNEDDNAAVEGAHKLEESGEGVYRLEQRSARRRKQWASRKRSRLERQEEKQAQAASHQEQKKLKKQIQKQQIKWDYAKAKRSEQTVGTATKGTIDYIKKIGGKVTNFFKENRKVYISVAVLIGLMFLIITNVTSCSAVFLQNVITYTGTSYLSSDQAIREAELYYTQLEANLQERINNMESEEPGHEEYRYNIGPIEHDPFILISYLSAKYEEFTFEQVKPELDALFALQYRLETEAVNETVTETATVRVGESLGQVVTSGYCNCPICCGIWSGGPTASGAYPTANHTLAVDASNPFVPMGTKVVMNGVEYTVEDTGAFARYGVQFDVYYDSHAAASAHGHQTWECYLADDNGSNEVEVTRTRDVDVLNVTLNSGNLMSICQDRLGFFQKELFSAYNDTKGNLQMFATPVDFNWYSSVTSYYGYRIHPISGANQLHNGMDIGAPEGTKVMAGLTGTVTTSAYNDSYGNYVVIKDSKGYELRYAHLSSRSVSAG
ncbi:MAG: CD1108 family mobile element protein, partial [Ruminococcus sp.]